MPRNSTRPPAWATDGNYVAPGESWNATARRVVAGLAAFAAAGLIPEGPTEAQSFNEWLAEMAEFVREPYPAMFGNATDGATVISGTTTLTDDLHATTLVVQNGGILHTNGFRVFAQTSITVDVGGVIDCDGSDGGDGSAVGPTGGAAGAARAAGTLGAIGVGRVGGAGASNGLVGADATTGLGGDGGAGGDTNTNTGGAAGSSVAPTAAQGRHGSGFTPGADATPRLGHVLQAIAGRALDGTLFTGGAPGGSGAGINPAGAGGGSGSGGGVMLLCSPTITNNGTIRAEGGDGGDGIAGVAGGGGGGGGGGGAIIRITRDALAGSGTWSVAGGAPGGSTGAFSSPGIVGTAGQLYSYLI